MDGHCPDVDQYEHDEVRVLVHGEEEHVQMVGGALQEAVQWVEGVTCKWRRDLKRETPLVSVTPRPHRAR